MKIALEGTRLVLSDHALTASVDGPVLFGHLGCRSLGKVLEDHNRAQREAKKKGTPGPPSIPAALLARWDHEVPGWRNSEGAAEDVGGALRRAIGIAAAGGIQLWDTMRGGSDYWRPGKLLGEAATASGATRVEYARVDELCPPADLLESFRTTTMSFPEYADRYADWIGAKDRIDLAVAAAVQAQARGLLAVFYCTDPYVPGYADPSQIGTEARFTARRWPLSKDLRHEGCHRVVLADLLCRRLTSLGVGVELIELDPTTRSAKKRVFAAP